LISLEAKQLPQSAQLEPLAQVVGLQAQQGFKVALEQRAWDQQEPQARLALLVQLD
jgi:SRSO17 transposase